MTCFRTIGNFFSPPIDTSLRAIPQYLQDAWKAAGFDTALLMSHPDFADALYKGKLIDPLKEMGALDKEAKLLVEGEPTSWADIQKRFSLDSCSSGADYYKRELVFRDNNPENVHSKKDPNDTYLYYYLKDGRGLHKLSQKLLQKWSAAGFKMEMLEKFPEFAEMLRDTRILDQMQAMGAVPEWKGPENNKEPAILVNGDLMSWSEIKDQFTWPSWDEIQEGIKDASHPEWQKLILSQGEKDHYLRFNVLIKKGTNDTYFHFADGNGLQVHDAINWKQMPTVAVLNSDEITRVQTVAKRFLCKEYKKTSIEGAEPKDRLNDDRNFVMQIVASKDRESSFAFTDTTSNPSHPYINIIATGDLEVEGQTLYKGHVYQIGFWGARVPEGLTRLEGRFYSYDPHSTRSYGERLVTSMAVSEEEVQAVIAKIHDRKNWKPTANVTEKAEEPQGFFEKLAFKAKSFCCETVEIVKTKTSEFANGPKAQRLPFHPTRQNCSACVQALCHEAGIEMNADVTVFRLIGESFPPVIRKIGVCIYKWACYAAAAIAPLVRKVVPEKVRNWLCEKILWIWHGCIKLLHFVFVGTFGKVLMIPAGDSLMGLDQDALLEERKEAPWHIPSLLWRYVHYLIIHPIGIRDYQLSYKVKVAKESVQGTTYVYTRPTTIKETIVPPDDEPYVEEVPQVSKIQQFWNRLFPRQQEPQTA